MRRSRFLVGRLSGRNTLVLLVGSVRCRIVRPWAIRAVISPN
jgi:hypothetical protein